MSTSSCAPPRERNPFHAYHPSNLHPQPGRYNRVWLNRFSAHTAFPMGRYGAHDDIEAFVQSHQLSRRQRRGGGYKVNPNTAYVWIGAAPRGPGVLAEFGTGPRYHKKTRKFVGAMPAQPFLRPAWEQHKDQILEDFSKALWIQIEKSAKRLARRQAKAAGIKP